MEKIVSNKEYTPSNQWEQSAQALMWRWFYVFHRNSNRLCTNIVTWLQNSEPKAEFFQFSIFFKFLTSVSWLYWRSLNLFVLYVGFSIKNHYFFLVCMMWKYLPVPMSQIKMTELLALLIFFYSEKQGSSLFCLIVVPSVDCKEYSYVECTERPPDVAS